MSAPGPCTEPGGELRIDEAGGLTSGDRPPASGSARAVSGPSSARRRICRPPQARWPVGCSTTSSSTRSHFASRARHECVRRSSGGPCAPRRRRSPGGCLVSARGFLSPTSSAAPGEAATPTSHCQSAHGMPSLPPSCDTQPTPGRSPNPKYERRPSGSHAAARIGGRPAAVLLHLRDGCMARPPPRAAGLNHPSSHVT